MEEEIQSSQSTVVGLGMDFSSPNLTDTEVQPEKVARRGTSRNYELCTTYDSLEEATEVIQKKAFGPRNAQRHPESLVV